MALIDAHGGVWGLDESTQGPDDHLGVLVAVEGRGGTDDAVVHIACVVEDGPAA